MAQNKSKTSNRKGAQTAPVVKPALPVKAWPVIPEWVGVGLLVLFTVLIRWQFLDIPLERDESVYYYAGKAALDGGRPYFDFYEMKPPGLFYSYAFLIALFGYSGTGAHLALLFVSLSNAAFTYLIARHFGGKRLAQVAATAFVFFSLNPGASGLYLVAEHLALLWGLPGVWLALQYPERTNKYLLLGSGALLSMAVLVKQTAGVFGLAVVVYWLIRWLQNGREQSLKPLLWWVMGGIFPIFCAFLVVWAAGTMQDAHFWLYEYPQLYSTSANDDKIGLYFKTSWKLVSMGYEGYFVFAGLGLLALWWSRLSLASKAFITVWALLSALTIVPGMRFYGHYYLLAFPAACIAGAMLFDTIGKRITQKDTMPVLLLALGLLWSAHHILINNNLYIRPPLRMISRVYSPGNPFIEHQILAEELKKVLQPNDTIAVFGSDPQYFIYLDKPSPIRHVYMPFVAKGQYPEALEWQQETIRRLKETRPQYVIFNSYPYAWLARYDLE
ncbi:MAG TPA: glycosyltransferase family 39 protein, partial [Saprospiraceae bacterium]|nr:glycosyltransferase family 39 protein [Saprospiraceae bacterium]